ncbi:MAG: SPY protein, partial [Magnetospirillum sp.]|nr:SPY protein [Magnetospirillum sp.]
TGTSFAGRVASGVLRAAGLPELVTSSLTQYEGLALALAGDPGRLAALKLRLERERDRAPLFDNARFTGNIEAAFLRMWENRSAGKKPQAFAV